MNRFKLFALALVMFGVSLITAASPAFALQCKTGNYGSDECWTTGQTVTNDVGQIIAGTIMVYDFETGVNEGNSADNAAFYVRTATSVDKNHIVAGVAQKTYATGDRVQLLVRGKGKLRVNASVTSGDRLFVARGSVAQRGIAAPDSKDNGNSLATRDKAIAFALTTTSAAATTDAFITVI